MSTDEQPQTSQRQGQERRPLTMEEKVERYESPGIEDSATQAGSGPLTLEHLTNRLWEAYMESTQLYLSYEEIARATGVSRNAFRSIRKGTSRHPTWDTIAAMSDFFGISAEYFRTTSWDEMEDYIARRFGEQYTKQW